MKIHVGCGVERFLLEGASWVCREGLGCQSAFGRPSQVEIQAMASLQSGPVPLADSLVNSRGKNSAVIDGDERGLIKR